MPGSNFDKVLTFDPEGRIYPRGPLEHVPGETVEKLYAWVFQLNPDKTGAACIAGQEDQTALATDEWTTPAAVTEGSFGRGAAVGMAVTISKDAAGKKRVYWWSETIFVDGKP
jgi:hypothetical protein